MQLHLPDAVGRSSEKKRERSVRRRRTEMGVVPDGGGGIGGRRQVRPFLLKETTPGEEKVGGWDIGKGSFRGKPVWLKVGACFVRSRKERPGVEVSGENRVEKRTWSP